MDGLFLKKKLEDFLLEDVYFEDISSNLKDFKRECRGYIVVKNDAVIGGIDFVITLFTMVDGDFKVLKRYHSDGDIVKTGEKILEFSGRGDLILKCERLSINLLQRISGIATNTREYVKALEGSGIKLLDTRKTTPGFRFFEKYGVRLGGGHNHRMGLFDAVMIKDNHLSILKRDFSKVNELRLKIPITAKVEIECETLEDVKMALEVDPDIIMLDNFSVEDIKEAVKIINGRSKIEVSGGIDIKNIKNFIIPGVDFISTSKVITDARWIDISLEID